MEVIEFLTEYSLYWNSKRCFSLFPVPIHLLFGQEKQMAKRKKHSFSKAVIQASFISNE
ncbi:hypothetical protein [Alkalihalobacillus sp. TS-13]|uniref:hypothetical protein n=1 Tax=Alkalihalobacillus sp. TS-13 TaxID=2842455 RepID=UPI001C87BDA8|nr:hypothetical protein [Alkalihalobacillus sp. TS-13]